MQKIRVEKEDIALFHLAIDTLKIFQKQVNAFWIGTGLSAKMTVFNPSIFMCTFDYL